LFIIPAFIFVAACSVSLSIKLIRKIFIRQTFSFQLVPVFSRYVLAYIATILVITIAASIEAYLTPALMNAIIAGFLISIFLSCQFYLFKFYLLILLVRNSYNILYNNDVN